MNVTNRAQKQFLGQYPRNKISQVQDRTQTPFTVNTIQNNIVYLDSK